MNNYSIDGANFNNSMGLDGAVLPGGGNPISIDALDEIQVSIAPYDVRQTNFIGASVNAVTKSGTNQFRGSGYMLRTRISVEIKWTGKIWVNVRKSGVIFMVLLWEGQS